MSDGKPSAGTAPKHPAMLEKVDLSDAVKAEVLELESKLATADYFSLLGVPADAEPAVVKKAFHELCRRIHPDRYFRKNLGSFKLRMETVFKALSTAHQALTDPERREEYLKAHPRLRKQPGGQKRAGAQRIMLNKKDLELPPIGTQWKGK